MTHHDSPTTNSASPAAADPTADDTAPTNPDVSPTTEPDTPPIREPESPATDEPAHSEDSSRRAWLKLLGVAGLAGLASQPASAQEPHDHLGEGCGQGQ